MECTASARWTARRENATADLTAVEETAQASAASAPPGDVPTTTTASAGRNASALLALVTAIALSRIH